MSDHRDDSRLERDADRVDEPTEKGESHASTGGAVVAGAATGGLVGMAAGPVGAAVGAVGGAIVGAVSERVMHGDNDQDHTGDNDGHDHANHPELGNASTEPTAHAGNTVQLREEEVTARKEMTERGRVEIGKNVVTESRSVEVPVTREEVYVDRRSVDRRPSDSPISDSGGSIEVPVREEQVSFEKRPVVYEEVSVGKRVEQDTERVDTTVRREVADINKTGDVNVSGNPERRI